MQESICKLCEQKVADKTGSHIIPFFLLRKMVNDEGKKARDNEVSFRISTSEMVNYHFGKSLLPEKIETFLGREMTQEEIEQNFNQFIRDHIFCSECEKRFQTIETEFSSSFYNKRQKFTPDSNHSNSLNYKTISGDTALTIRAFFLSIIWRCSASRIFDNSIDRTVQSKIRELLMLCLPLEQNDLLGQLKKNERELRQYPMGLMFLNEQSSDVCITHPVANAPYYFVFDEFVLFFYSKKKAMYQSLAKAFAIERLPLKSIINLQEGDFKMGFLANKEAKDLRENIINTVVSRIDNKLTRDFKALFFHYTGRLTPSWLVSEVMYELSGSTTVDAYSQSRILSIFKKYINRYRR
jgi:hypothetical protein